MKKILLSVLVLMAAVWNIDAQTTINNGNMELWQNVGSNTEEPTYWNSNKTGLNNASSVFAPKTCQRDTSTLFGGQYCAKVTTGSAIGIAVNGALTTGQVDAPTTNKADGYIISRANDANNSMAFTGRPDSFVFWYRFTKTGSDYARVEARLHVNNCYAPETKNPDSAVNIIARAQFLSPAATQATWTRVSVPFTYVDNRTPQYIFITSTSSGDQLNGSIGSTLYLDQFTVVYNPTLATGTVNAGPYYVSSTTGATIDVPYTLTGTFDPSNTITVQLSDASGSFASPVTIGSAVSAASGTISATIPANTASGTGYRVRVVSSNPAITAANNGSDITINLVANSIAPMTAQTIAAGTNGTTLTVTESAGFVSRSWKYATTSGGSLQAITPAQTSTNYTPNFATAGSYYVVAVTTYPGGLEVTSDEVLITVVSNSIAPAAPQSILTATNGDVLTVTETPTGMWREWLFATTPGGPYSSFTPAITGSTTYTPNFNTAGVYYVVCKSEINGLMVISNEVQISVNSVTLSTGTISGSPFEFSASAPAITVVVNYTTSGNFNGPNVFTAQLSDASGSFASPTTIGTKSAVSSDSIHASIPASTPAGTGYRIRVVASDPVVLGNDNGSNLVVDQFNNSIAPTATQSIVYNTNGTALTVTASQNATHEWKYTTTSGSGYTGFSPAQTNATYTPNFATPGTYYVVAVSRNQYNDDVVSNEVQIDVLNGTTLTTSAVAGSPFLVSDSSNVTLNVAFTSNVIFNGGNIFTAQLSDANGSFTSPVTIGTLNGTTVAPVAAVIPNTTPAGTGYRIRVVSSNPAITGTDNGTDLEVIPFSISLAPADTQRIFRNQDGDPITATSTHPATYNWLYSEVQGLGHIPFSPVQTAATYTPRFAQAKTYYVLCDIKNADNAVLRSQEVVIVVTTQTGIEKNANDLLKAYWSNNDFVVDLSASTLINPTLELMNVNGQIVVSEKLNAASVNRIATALSTGTYLFKITDGDKTFTGKTTR